MLRRLLGRRRKEPAPKYRALRTDEIRLIRFVPSITASSKSGLRSLRLEYFQLYRAPSYIALSYCWGDEDDTLEATLNGKSIRITRNLHDALCHIHSLESYFRETLSRTVTTETTKPSKRDPILYIWVDTLCINQSDVDEKSVQVPRMAEIFGSSYTTLIWLGSTATLESDDTELDIFANTLSEMTPSEVLPAQRHTSCIVQLRSGTEDSNKLMWLNVLRTYSRLMSSAWMDRLWVMQEYALSPRDPIVLAGYAVFSFQAFFNFGGNLLNFTDTIDPEITEAYSSGIKGISYSSKLALGRAYFRDVIRQARFKEATEAEKLITAIMHTNDRLSTMPHDQIYGFLGLVDVGNLPRELSPDYSRRYEDVCHAYTRYLIHEAKDLRVMMASHASTVSQVWSGEQPTWVADFRHVEPLLDRPITSHSGPFSSDARRLVVQGVRCHRVVLLFASTGDADDNPEQHLRRFYDEMVIASAKIWGHEPASVWKAWFAEFLVKVLHQQGNLAYQYESAAEYLEAAANNWDGDPRSHLDSKSLLTYFCAQHYALRDDGRISACTFRSQIQHGVPDDTIWAFKGAEKPYIVRQVSPGQYQYIGWLRELYFTLDEAYFARHTFSEISIV